MSAKNKLKHAKHLVEQGEYNKARKLIKSINHPKQKDWLKQIDAKEAKMKQKGNNGCVAIFVVLVLIFLIFWAVDQTTPSSPKKYLSNYCQTYNVVSNCDAWADLIYEARQEIVDTCYEDAAGSQTVFNDCMDD